MDEAYLCKKFICKICGQNFKLAKEILHHFKVHMNIYNLRYPCPISNCKLDFQKLKTLRSHLDRKHVNSRLFEEKVENITYECSVNFCQELCPNKQYLINHLRKHLKDKHDIKCPYKNCDKYFSNASTFSSHLSRYHREASCDTHSNKEMLTVSENNEFEYETSSQSLVAENNLGKPQLHLTVARFYLYLISKHHIAANTINFIMENFRNMHSYKQHHLNHILNKELKLLNVSQCKIEELIKSLETQDLITSVYSDTFISSKYLRYQYFKEKFNFVEPVQMYLGRDDNNRVCHYHYVPIKESLNALLASATTKQYTKKCTSNSMIFEDYQDGKMYKNNVLFKNEALHLILYQDAFEIVNPLGSGRKKHKILAVYYCLGNFEPWCRNRIDNIQLVLLCKEQYFRTFGQDNIFNTFINDLKAIENGFNIGTDEVVPGGVVAISGDNLGSHFIGGFSENFSCSEYPCRYCLVTREEMFEDQFYAKNFEMRNKNNYDEAVEKLRENTEHRHVQGIKFKSIFNKLKYFHVSSPGLPPCIAHDFFEGVVAYDMHLYLMHLIKEKILTLKGINNKISKFKYQPSDSRDIPCAINIKSKKLSGNAVQNWTFLRLFPIMYYESNEIRNSPVWLLIILLHEIVQLVCAPKLALPQIYYLRTLLEEYMEERANMFPEKPLRPKHHYILHYPSLMIQFGPLIRFWTLRFESKHAYFKQCARHSRNYKNVTKTLSERHQLYQAFINTGDRFISRELYNFMPFQKELFNKSIVKAIEEIYSGKNLHYSNKVVYKGTEYRKDMFVVLARQECLLKFGQIMLILIINEQIYFAVAIKTALYEASNTFILNNNNEQENIICVHVTNLLDYYPLDKYEIKEKSIIVLKHAVLDDDF